MRLRNLELAGFRAFAAEAQFDLSADAIVLVGPNGSGKTSLLDALLWILCGSVPRIGGSAELVSVFSRSGGAYGTLHLGDGKRTVEIGRSYDGDSASLTFSAPGEQQTRGPAALARLCETLWPEALATDDELGALTAAITRSIYLQQDLVRQFIEADTDQQRFEAVSELFGAGRVAEFQVQIDRARSGWTRAKNELEAEANRVRSRLGELDLRLGELSEATSSGEELSDRWRRWWSAASTLDVDDPSLSVFSPQAGQRIDEAIRQLSAVRRDRERRLAEVRQLDAEIREASPPGQPDLEALAAALSEATTEAEAARTALAAAETAAAEERKRHVALREARSELQSLAQLALRHLGDRCPVCDQTYDESATRERLEALLEESTAGPTLEATPADAVTAAAERLRVCEEAQATATHALQSAQADVRAVEARAKALRSRLAALGYEGEPGEEALDGLEAHTSALADAIELATTLEADGGNLAVELARASEAAKRDELEQETSSVRSRLAALDAEVDRRERAAELAVRLAERLREATSEVVEAELERIAPLLQQIFSTIDPHPAFRSVRLVSRFSRGRGRIDARLEDLVSGKVTDAPAGVLSSSQLNGLAVAAFLGLNLGVRALPLQTVILDDPLQSLDDVNLLGLVDLLRRTREHRQLVVSTHDPRFGDLLARKLRPVEPGQRTLIYRFNGWSRSGPSVDFEEVSPDSGGLRIAHPAA